MEWVRGAPFNARSALAQALQEGSASEQQVEALACLVVLTAEAGNGTSVVDEILPGGAGLHGPAPEVCAHVRRTVCELDLRWRATAEVQAAVRTAQEAARAACGDAQTAAVVELARGDGAIARRAQQMVRALCAEAVGDDTGRVETATAALTRRGTRWAGCCAERSVGWNVAACSLWRTADSLEWAQAWGQLVGRACNAPAPADTAEEVSWLGSARVDGVWHALGVRVGGAAHATTQWQAGEENGVAWVKSQGVVGEWLTQNVRGTSESEGWVRARAPCDAGDAALLYDPEGPCTLRVGREGLLSLPTMTMAQPLCWNRPDESAWPVGLVRVEQEPLCI